MTFILLNETKPARGDVEVTVYPEKGLMDALDALKNSVQSGKFKVEFQQGKDCTEFVGGENWSDDQPFYIIKTFKIRFKGSTI